MRRHAPRRRAYNLLNFRKRPLQRNLAIDTPQTIRSAPKTRDDRHAINFPGQTPKLLIGRHFQVRVNDVPSSFFDKETNFFSPLESIH